MTEDLTKSNDKIYFITEAQLGRISSVIIEDANHKYQTGFFECIRSQTLLAHDTAIREDERKRALTDDCDYRIVSMINGGSRVYTYPGGVFPKKPIDVFEISKKGRELLYKTIESLRSLTQNNHKKDGE
jgi:hypothetical protein